MEVDFIIKVGYYIAISPFRFSRGKDSKGNLEMKAPQTQKVICCILHISSICLCTLVKIILEARAEMKKGNPKLIFGLAMNLNVQCHTSYVLYILWYRSQELRKVVEEFGFGEDGVSRYVKSVLLTLTLLPMGILLYPAAEQLAAIGTELLGCSTPGTNVTSSKIPFVGWAELLNFWDKGCPHNPTVVRLTFAVVYLFYVYLFILDGYSNSLLLASAFSVYRMTSTLHKITTTASKCPKSLIRDYKIAKGKIGMLNKVLSLAPLLATMEFVMYASLVIPFALVLFTPSSTIDIIISIIVIGSYIVAAEANRQMGEVEKFIISSYPFDAPNIALGLWSSPGNCGLKGWNFFTFSYGFVGAVGSAIFTYMLVVSQIPS